MLINESRVLLPLVTTGCRSATIHIHDIEGFREIGPQKFWKNHYSDKLRESCRQIFIHLPVGCPASLAWTPITGSPSII